jgi:hypothetical protein
MLPVIRQIVDKSKKNSRAKRLRAENIEFDEEENDKKRPDYTRISSEINIEYSINTVINVDDIFKPKIYKIKMNEDLKKTKIKKEKP